MSVTIMGLGPGSSAHLTREAWQVLQEAGELYVRTRRHPVIGELPAHLAIHDFDGVYEREGDFAAVYEAIARQVIALSARPGGVLYAVPGHPLVGEASVQRILALAREARIPARIVAGLASWSRR